MVGNAYFLVVAYVLDAGDKLIGHKEVVEPGAAILRAVFVLRPPPRVDSVLKRIEIPESIDKAHVQEVIKARAFLGLKDRLKLVELLVLGVDVDMLVRNIEVAGDDHGFLERIDVLAKRAVEAVSVLSARLIGVRVEVWNVYVHNVAGTEIGCDDAALAVKTLDVEPVFHGKRQRLR